MHYPDLTPCDYFDLPTSRLLAVGWLDSDFPYTKGPVPSPFVTKLEALIAEAWDYRGFMGGDWCTFCPTVTLDVRAETFSSRNIFVPFDGNVYVAPEGILHYIRAHDYQPPQIFVHAVLECPPQDSIAFFEAVELSGILNTSAAEAHRQYQAQLIHIREWQSG